MSEEGATAEASEESFYLARWTFNYAKLVQLAAGIEPDALSDEERGLISDHLLQRLLSKKAPEDISVYRMEQLDPRELGHAAAVLGMCLAWTLKERKDLEQNRYDEGNKTSLGGALSIAARHIRRCGLLLEKSPNGCTHLSPAREYHWDIKVAVEQHEAAIKVIALALADDDTFVGVSPLPSEGETTPQVFREGTRPYQEQAEIILRHCEAEPYLLTKTSYASDAWIESTLSGRAKKKDQAKQLRLRAAFIKYELPP